MKRMSKWVRSYGSLVPLNRKRHYGHSIKIAIGHCCPIPPNRKIHHEVYLSPMDFFLPPRTFVYHQIEMCPYKSRCSDRVKEFRTIVLQLPRTGCYRQITRSVNAEDSKHRETKLHTDEALDFLHFICKELSNKFTQNSYLFSFPGWASSGIWFYGLVLFIAKLVSILWEEFDI